MHISSLNIHTYIYIYIYIYITYFIVPLAPHINYTDDTFGECTLRNTSM